MHSWTIIAFLVICTLSAVAFSATTTTTTEAPDMATDTTEASTEGSTAASTQGSTAAQTEGSTAASTQGSTATSTQGSTAAQTEASTVITTQSSTSGSSGNPGVTNTTPNSSTNTRMSAVMMVLSGVTALLMFL